jgi:3-dehydro-L-gulonate 2-dehydrogenase
VFIAINPTSVGAADVAEAIVRGALADLQSSNASRSEDVRYPGEQVLKTRKQNSESGIPVSVSVWQELQQMLRRT